MQYISVTIDNDSIYSNGVISTSEVQDSSVNIAANTASNIKIVSTALSTNYIRTPQNIVISFDTGAATGIFTTAGKYLYMTFPSSYSQWLSRAQALSTVTSANTSIISCQVVVTSTATNLATACVFISQRILQITMGAVTNSLFTITIANIMSPSVLPSGKYNQYLFKLFVSDASLNYITYYSFTDYSATLSLTTNPNLIDLSWVYRNITSTDSLISLPLISNQVITVQIGYYSNVIELRQSSYPANFQTSMQLSLSSLPAADFTYVSTAMNISLGYPTCYFRIAASSIISPGLYTLQFTKAGDTNTLYTNIPPLTLVVQSQLCVLTTDSTSYTLPLGGSTLPITIDAIRCIPTLQISLQLTFTSA